MHQHRCEICGRTATTHDTAVESGAAQAVRHLCQQHAGIDWRSLLLADAASSQNALASLIEWHRGLSDGEKSQLEMEYRLRMRRR